MTKIMLGSALRNVCGPLADLNAKLAGPDGNSKWLPALKRFLREENPWDGKPLFPVWKTVTIEGRPSMNHLIQTLEDEGFVLGFHAQDVLINSSATLAREVQEIDLIKVAAKDLGFDDMTTYPAVFRRIKELGLAYCSSEAAAEARRSFTEQEPDDSVSVVIKPIQLEGIKFTLDLFHSEEGELHLVGYDYLNAGYPTPTAEFICVQPRGK